MSFFSDLWSTPFLQYAALAALLASVASGVVGSYVVVRRITYLAGSIAHCVLAGMGAARYCQVVFGWTWLDPIYGAIVSALLAAVIVGGVSLWARQREDTVIGAIWAVGTAIGVLFIWKTPGYSIDLTSYLFGNILMVSPQDLWLIGLLDVLVLGLVYLFYNQFLAVCFDEEFARLRGLQVDAYYILLLCLTALTVVVLVKVVGIVMAIALLTLPIAVACRFARTLWGIMVTSTLLTIGFSLAGLGTAYHLNLPAGATIIMLAGAGYLLTAVLGGRHAR